MKIGIEVQRLFRKQKFGIESSALQLIKKLQALNPSTEFVVYAKNDVDRSCLSESENLKVKTLSGKVFFDFEQFFLPLATKQDRVHVLHCTGNTTPWFSTVPVVQTLHDVIFMDPISTNDTLYQQFGNYYRRKMIPIITPKSDAVITVSNYQKERILERLKIDERKIKVIYNGIDEQRFKIIDDKQSAANVRKKYKLPANFILFLGNTASRKNALRVLEAYCMYASSTEKPLPIVTPGLPSELISDELTVLNQQDKFRKFITPGYIDDADLPALYNASTLFLYPSLSEGFGMPVVEAMACGTPVITSNVSCLPEIAGDAALLIDPFNAREIAQAITNMLTNQTLRLDKVVDGLINARRFSWNNTAAEVFDIYEKVYFRTKRISQYIGNMAFETR
ncbi:MAG TPA: glycosyltransferase family 1 protein [Chryseosolibacter sp.]|nr:glycosyltransferase family 1 protein [Chryseosolibacter sp.]